MLDEPLPPGTGWFFTLGSVLLALLSIQLLTGAFLTLYYAATPDHAYDSVRFINTLRTGNIVRGLHHYGASFIVDCDGGAHVARDRVRLVQAAARSDVAIGAGAPRADPRVRADRVSAAVGSARLLGDGRHDQHLQADAACGRDHGRRSSRRIDDRRADAHPLVLGARDLPASRARPAHRRSPVPDATARDLRSGPRPHGIARGIFSSAGRARHDHGPAGRDRPGLLRVARCAAARRTRRSDRRDLHSATGVVFSRPVSAAEILPRQVGSRRRDGSSGNRRRVPCAVAVDRSGP